MGSLTASEAWEEMSFWGEWILSLFLAAGRPEIVILGRIFSSYRKSFSWLDPLQLWMEISHLAFAVSLAYHRISSDD